MTRHPEPSPNGSRNGWILGGAGPSSIPVPAIRWAIRAMRWETVAESPRGSRSPSGSPSQPSRAPNRIAAASQSRSVSREFRKSSSPAQSRRRKNNIIARDRGVAWRSNSSVAVYSPSPVSDSRVSRSFMTPRLIRESSSLEAVSR